MLLVKFLPKNERNQSFHSFSHKQGMMLLNDGMKRSCGIDVSESDIIAGQHGKPYFKSYPYYFNISHCKKLAVCALSDCEIGADCEGIRKASPNVITRCFSEQEKNIINSADNPDAAFSRLWTLKESYVKLTGEGLSSDLSKISFDLNNNMALFNSGCNFYQLIINNSYFISVCGNKSGGEGKITVEKVNVDIDICNILVYNIM